MRIPANQDAGRKRRDVAIRKPGLGRNWSATGFLGLKSQWVIVNEETVAGPEEVLRLRPAQLQFGQHSRISPDDTGTGAASGGAGREGPRAISRAEHALAGRNQGRPSQEYCHAI